MAIGGTIDEQKAVMENIESKQIFIHIRSLLFIEHLDEKLTEYIINEDELNEIIAGITCLCDTDNHHIYTIAPEKQYFYKFSQANLEIKFTSYRDQKLGVLKSQRHKKFDPESDTEQDLAHNEYTRIMGILRDCVQN